MDDERSSRVRGVLDRELDRAWAELTAVGGPFEVATTEIGGRPLRHYLRAPPTMAALWAETTRFGEHDHLVFGTERFTYERAHAISASVAVWLTRCGVRPGDRVAVAMRNYPEWLLIYWACLSMGVSAVGMNAWWTPDEMNFALGDAAPKVVFCDAERLDRLRQCAGATGIAVVAVRTEPTGGAVAWEEVTAVRGAAPDVRVEPDDDACIFYTSGTTGNPKGARLTHRGCINNMMNIVFALQVQAMAIARATGGSIDLGTAPNPVGLVTTPLFHVTANNCLAHVVTAAGGTLVLMRKWDPGEALRLIEAERVTTLGGVPTMVREVLQHADAARRDLSSLITLSAGGAQLTPDLVAKVDAHPSPARPSTGYGMTETCGIVTAISGEFLVDRPESCGRIMPTFEAKVVDGDGRGLSAGTPGELCVRGAGVIKGYLNRPDETAETILEGWLHTGDIGRIDEDGFVYLLDRKKDMVLRGGENVYCAEVEAALFRHPLVAEVCVFGVADERLGEEVGAAVVLRPDEQATAAGLRAHIAGSIARHKIPRYLWILDEPLPRNASGKFLRRELRGSLALRDAL